MSTRGRLLMWFLVALLIPATGAGAQFVTTKRSVVVSTPGAVVSVQRSPFRLRIARGGRNEALSEVANSQPQPAVMPPTADPMAPGTEPARSGQLYAPLSFLVGTYSLKQYDGLLWGGNLMEGTRSGVQFAARKVTRVRHDGSGARLTLTTNDPTGRTLTVTITSAGRGLVKVSVKPHPAKGVTMMTDAFRSSPHEAFYGFGGRHNALNQRGENLASFVEEENIPPFKGVARAGTPAAELFPNGPPAAYYPQAQFISSQGYGFLLDQPQAAWFRLDSDRRRAWDVAVKAASLSYVVAPGTPRAAIGALTRLTGRQPAPPAWAAGPTLDRLVKNIGETNANYESELTQDLRNIARYHLPLTAYRIEGWGFRGSGNHGLDLITHTSFALQTKVIRKLKARHIHPLAYLRPFITPGSRPDKAGLTIRKAGGGPYYTTTTTGTQIALLDFTNPRAVRWWSHQVAKVLNLGFDGFMADFGEEVLAGMHFHDGRTGATMHNAYPILYMRATREAVRTYARTHPHRHIWFFNRSGYSGTPGSARYEGGNFPGDEATNWGHAAGLASLTSDMLGRAIGGAFGYATDIGGYYDYTTPATTRQLFLRWAEWATLSPVFRLHGSGRSGTHTPWSYDRQTVRVYNALSRLHERARPLILRLWRQADHTGIPPTRPLWLQFPDDPRAARQQQEWMLGSQVLVAPVVVRGATRRRIYLPAGCWRDPQTGRTVRGRRSVTVRAPLSMLPFFFRCGTRPFDAG